MESRMEKYYRDDLSTFERTKRNQKLYNDISGQIDGLENLPIDDNVNENYQFIRYHLKDEEKKVLTPRNTTFFYKIFDLLINW